MTFKMDIETNQLMIIHKSIKLISFMIRVIFGNYVFLPRRPSSLVLLLWLSTKRGSCDSNYSTFRLPWVYSLHCRSKNFFLFFEVHLRISFFSSNFSAKMRFSRNGNFEYIWCLWYVKLFCASDSKFWWKGGNTMLSFRENFFFSILH